MWIGIVLLFIVGIPCDHSGILGLSKYFRSHFPNSWIRIPNKSKISSETSKKRPMKVSNHSSIAHPYKKVANLNDPNTNRAELFPNLTIDHLCIDMNQILHCGMRTKTSSSNNKQMMAKIFTKLDEVMRMVQPQQSLVLSFDGAAPFAKMQTQRLRRWHSMRSAMITPGTDFMNAMNDLSLCYVIQRYCTLAYKNISSFISSPNSPGEGEVKIM